MKTILAVIIIALLVGGIAYYKYLAPAGDDNELSEEQTVGVGTSTEGIDGSLAPSADNTQEINDLLNSLGQEQSGEAAEALIDDDSNSALSEINQLTNELDQTNYDNEI